MQVVVLNAPVVFQNVDERNEIMVTLLVQKDTYMVDSEAEVQKLIEEAKNNFDFELAKYSSQKKVLRKTGEEYFLVTLEKKYNG